MMYIFHKMCVYFQDPVTKNWWLSVENKFIGYFPIKLFSNMTSADQVGWGGRTKTHLDTNSPQMGSGHLPHFPYYNYNTRVCYFRQVFIRNSLRKSHEVQPYETYSFTDNPNCYDVKYPKSSVGYVLLFGGPGGKCGN